MPRLATLLTTLALPACVSNALALNMEHLSEGLEASLAVAELAFTGTRELDPDRGPWDHVSDLEFLPRGGGLIESGPLRFSWRLNLRNLGLQHEDVEADLLAAAEVLGSMDLGACEVTELDIYEVETDFANEVGRFDLSMEPGADQVLVGVYDPRSWEPGLGAIVLTPLESAAERRALVAHELAHHAHHACHINGDSEVFAESIEAMFNTPLTPPRLAATPPVNLPSAAPNRTASAAADAPHPSAGRQGQPFPGPPPGAARARAMSRGKARRARAHRAHIGRL